jgi:hypothetical protein
MKVDWERWGRAAGIGFVVLAILAFVLGGEPPGVDGAADEVVTYFDEDRGRVLVSYFLFAIALGLLIWFAGTIANILRERGEGRVAATLTGAVAAFAAIQFVATGINAVLAYSVAGAGDARLAQALFELTWVLDVLAAVPSAVFFAAAAAGLLRTGIVQSWLGWAGLGVAVLFVLRSTNWASEGFWSPTGEYLLVLIPLTLLWILVTSVVLVRGARAPAMSAS